MPSAVLCWKCKRPGINTPQNAVPWRIWNLNLQELQESLILLLNVEGTVTGFTQCGGTGLKAVLAAYL